MATTKVCDTSFSHKRKKSVRILYPLLNMSGRFNDGRRLPFEALLGYKDVILCGPDD